MTSVTPRRCRLPWETLRDTATPDNKHCDKCGTNVRRVHTRQEFELAVGAGLCVWFDRLDEGHRELLFGGQSAPYEVGSLPLTWDE